MDSRAEVRALPLVAMERLAPYAEVDLVAREKSRERAPKLKGALRTLPAKQPRSERKKSPTGMDRFRLHVLNVDYLHC